MPDPLLRICFSVHKDLCRGVDRTRENVLLSDWAGTAVVTKFDQDHAGSDGGAMLLQAGDRQSDLTDARIGGNDAQCLSGGTRHGLEDLVRQRLYAIAYGRPGGHEADRSCADPTRKPLCSSDPLPGEDWASRSTLCHSEHSGDRAASNVVCLTSAERRRRNSSVEREPCSTIHRQRTDPWQNHRRASKSHLIYRQTCRHGHETPIVHASRRRAGRTFWGPAEIRPDPDRLTASAGAGAEVRYALNGCLRRRCSLRFGLCRRRRRSRPGCGRACMYFARGAYPGLPVRRNC